MCTCSGAGFLPWHRAYLSMIEHALQIARSDFSLRLPYWNWEGEHVLTSDIWEHLGSSVNNGDPLDDCVVTGPLRSDLWHPDRSECIRRSIYPTFIPMASQAELNNDIAINPIYEDFRGQTEGGGNRHNSLHNRFGFPSDMITGVSPRDPLFYFVSALLNYCLSTRLKTSALCILVYSITVSLTSCGTIGRRYTETDRKTTQRPAKSTISTLTCISSPLRSLVLE